MAETEGTQMEVLERKRVVMEGVTKSTTISSSLPVPLTGTCSAPPRERNTKELLISITNESKGKISTTKHQICRAPDLLRKDEKSGNSFEPVVVAIGPYHRGKARLQPAEDHKRAAALEFSSRRRIDEFYDKVKNVAAEARACYAEKFDLMTDEEFTQMLFFDGCFVLHFIDCNARNKMEEVPMSTHLHGFIVRDMFLLENQLPYVVLDALMTLKSVDLEVFFRKIGVGTPHSSNQTPYHLLDLLRTKLLGSPSDRQQPNREDFHVFRSVKELREVGIKFRKSKTACLSDIKFDRYIVWGKLSLPMIVIDDNTRPRLLNLIALEMSPGYENDYGIMSFVWFLDCLIDRVEDVRELREEGILLHTLGSDKQVAKLFNELATNLAPDFAAHASVLTKIREHRQNKFKVSIDRFLQTHFSSPWTAIAFVAAVFLLILTVVQTIYTVFPRRS